MTIKPVPVQFQSGPDEFQMNLGGRTQIRPLDLSSCSSEPQYRSLSHVPRVQSEDDDLIDIVAVVLFVGDVRPVKRGEADHKVRDIVLADHSVQRPMKLSAWNRFATNDVSFLTSWAEGFAVIGFRGVRPITYKGLSLVTTLSTAYVPEPTGDKADALRVWATQHTTLLEDWRAKDILLYSDETEKTITPLREVAHKKATSLWQDEKFWICASVPSLAVKDIYCYVGCSMCGHRVDDEAGTQFSCIVCDTQDAVASSRVTVNLVVVDATGMVKVTAFTKEVEVIVGLTAAEMSALKKNGDPSALTDKLSEVKDKMMLMQISPTNALSTSNALKWIVRAVEISTEQA